MGKVQPKGRETRNAKQKRRLRGANNRYIRPGALAQLRHCKACTAKSSLDFDKKTLVVVDVDKPKDDLVVVDNKFIDQSPTILSPVRFGFRPLLDDSPTILSPKQHELVPFLGNHDLFRQNNFLNTPKRPCDGECGSESRLESLPMDLMVKIMCHLHHDQLRAVFHVSQKIRKAVIHARHFHFNFTTPDRARQEMLRTTTPRPSDHWPFSRKRDEKCMLLLSPHTPKAPKHGPRPPSRVKLTEIRHIAANLFKEPAFSSNPLIPSVLQKPLCKSLGGSNRVLFYEDELCQAVSQNKLH